MNIFATTRQQLASVSASGTFIAIVLLAYSTCILASRMFFREEMWNMATIWPAAGVAVFSLLQVRGGRYLLVIFGLLAANVIVTYATGLPLPTSVIFAVANVVEALFAAEVLVRLRRSPAKLAEVRDLLPLVLASLSGALVGGAIASFSSLQGIGPSRLDLWWYWSRNHALGILLMLLALLPWTGNGHGYLRRQNRWRHLEAACFFIVLGFALYAAYGQPLESSPLMPYMVVPILMWSACRLPLQYTTAGGVLLGIATMVGTRMGTGLFAYLPYPPHARIAAAQAFTIIGLISSTLLALVFADRENAEQKARRSEDRHRSLLEHASDAIFSVDLQGRVATANSKTCEMLGYTPSELLELNIRDIISPTDLNTLPLAFDALREGKTLLRECRYRRKDGSLLSVENSVKQIADNLIQVIARDITERKRTEDSLRRSEASFRSLVENAPYGIGRSTVAGFFVAANPRLCQMLGYDSEQELMAVDLAKCVYCDPGQRADLVAKCQREGQVRGAEVLWRRKDGKQLTVHLSARFMPDQNHFELIAEDVTGQVELEEQLRQAQKLETLGALAGGIAHDFNNILMIIGAYGEMLSTGVATEDQRHRHAEKIVDAVERGASLTRQLLAFSRKQVLKTSVLHLGNVLADLCHMLKPLIGEDVLLLDVCSSPDLWPVLADRGQVERVIINLAINARDAMPHGGRLTLAARNVHYDVVSAANNKGVRAGDYVELLVKDSGCGMSSETLTRIFDPFFTTKPAGKGTGLGLSTVYGIVKQSEGYITVESREREGTTFRVYLPRTNDVQVLVGSSPNSDSFTIPARVLVVEDEESTREAICSYLERRGFRVASAGSSAEALAICSDAGCFPDLLLSDVILPDQSGTDLVEQLRRRHAELKVILMSGYASDRVSPETLASAGFDFLQKPFELSNLVSKIRSLTGKD